MKIILILFLFLSPALAFASSDTIKSKDTVQVPSKASNEPLNIDIQNNLPSGGTNYFDKLIPIFTLLVGFFIGKIYETYERNRSIKAEGQEWVQNFIQLEDSLKKQVESISIFLEENPANKFRMGDTTFQFNLNCQAFQSLDDKSLAPYLRRKNKLSYKDAVKVAGKMKNRVRIIENTSELFNGAFTQLQTKSDVYNDGFKKSFSVFRSTLADYVGETLALDEPPKNQEQVTRAVIALNEKHLRPHLRSFELNIFELTDVFIPKFFNAAVDDRDNEHLKKAVAALSQCDQHIMDLITERKYLNSKLEKCSLSYQRSLDAIESINNESEG